MRGCACPAHSPRFRPGNRDISCRPHQIHSSRARGSEHERSALIRRQQILDRPSRREHRPWPPDCAQTLPTLLRATGFDAFDDLEIVRIMPPSPPPAATNSFANHARARNFFPGRHRPRASSSEANPRTPPTIFTSRNAAFNRALRRFKLQNHAARHNPRLHQALNLFARNRRQDFSPSSTPATSVR